MSSPPSSGLMKPVPCASFRRRACQLAAVARWPRPARPNRHWQIHRRACPGGARRGLRRRGQGGGVAGGERSSERISSAVWGLGVDGVHTRLEPRTPRRRSATGLLRSLVATPAIRRISSKQCDSALGEAPDLTSVTRHPGLYSQFVFPTMIPGRLFTPDRLPPLTYQQINRPPMRQRRCTLACPRQLPEAEERSASQSMAALTRRISSGTPLAELLGGPRACGAGRARLVQQRYIWPAVCPRTHAR